MICILYACIKHDTHLVVLSIYWLLYGLVIPHVRFVLVLCRYTKIGWKQISIKRLLQVDTGNIVGQSHGSIIDRQHSFVCLQIFKHLA